MSIAFHKPKTYRLPEGCCICRAKSSSSRFTESDKYSIYFERCFRLEEPREGKICNACVLLVKRFKKLPVDTERHWHMKVDSRLRPGNRGNAKRRRNENYASRDAAPSQRPASDGNNNDHSSNPNVLASSSIYNQDRNGPTTNRKNKEDEEEGNSDDCEFFDEDYDGGEEEEGVEMADAPMEDEQMLDMPSTSTGKRSLLPPKVTSCGQIAFEKRNRDCGRRIKSKPRRRVPVKLDPPGELYVSSMIDENKWVQLNICCGAIWHMGFRTIIIDYRFIKQRCDFADKEHSHMCHYRYLMELYRQMQLKNANVPHPARRLQEIYICHIAENGHATTFEDNKLVATGVFHDNGSDSGYDESSNLSMATPDLSGTNNSSIH